MLNLILANLAVLSFVLTAWRWWVARRFPLHRRLPPSASLPGVTLLKPLKGCNDETKHCLRSWFMQEYPGPVQILCGVATEDDPVCGIVRAILAEFPDADAQLVICGKSLGANSKVSKLRHLEPLIRQPIVLISDADVAVPVDFAANVTPMFADPNVGLVNSFYRLANPTTSAMRWEAVAINADFWTQVLQAQTIQKIDFALGAVMTLPVTMLQEIGGFATLADFLADDYCLGQNIAKLGRRIEFANVVVECWEAPMDWKIVWSHQLRWARTIRACQPMPFFFSILGNATLWPLLWLVASRDPAAVPVWLFSLAFRLLTATAQQKRLIQSDKNIPYWWMTPIKDILDALIWAAAFWGNHIDWRGQRYKIARGGKLVKVAVP